MSYRPGAAFAVVGDDGAIIVRADEALAVRLWELMVDRRWTDSEVLDVLVADGLSSAPQFCAIVLHDGTSTVIARGACSVTIRDAVGSSTVDGNSVSTWIEHSFSRSSETIVELAVDEAAGGPDLPIGSGVARADVVTVGTRSSDAVAAIEDLPPGTASPEPEHEPEVTPEPEPEPVPEAELPSGIDGFRPADPNATLAEVDDSRFDAMFGATAPGRRLEDAAVRDPVPDKSDVQPATGPTTQAESDEDDSVGDHDGHTMSAAELARLRAGRTSGAIASAPRSGEPATQSTVLATLELSTGRTVTLDRPVVLGRSPRVHGSTSANMQQAVIIDNPYVSGTHLLVAMEDGVVVVTDMSTNGTLIRRPDELPQRLDKGRETVVAHGTVLNLSDDISATVSVSGGGS